MRFHCGISFSWKSIKKFLLPFLLGILAYFGFNYIYNNDSIPLGFIKTNAFENYSSNYDYIIPNILDNTEDIDNIEDTDNIDNSLFLEDPNNFQFSTFHNYVYWFDNNDTSLGILSNIYILLFLYCIGMFTLKVINIIRNSRWK